MSSASQSRLALYAIAALLPASVAAQPATITGTVIDGENGTPLARAVIRVIGRVEVKTGQDGTYRLQLPPGAHELVATAIGFSAVRRTVAAIPAEGRVENFSLSMNPFPLAEVVTIGTRTSDRTATETPVPVDVVTAASLEASGLVETWQALQRLVPSVNVPHIPLGDNHARPVTLRGLAPHHVLVLVNGKRRHSGATVLSGPVIGATTSPDMSGIPASAIERIEVLRDGAAAQYGSDAIAGVVNIILKAGETREVGMSVGQAYTDEGGRTFRDGDVVNANASFGRQTGTGSWINLSAEFHDRATTNRAYPDLRDQYFAGDPRNESPKVISSHEGNGAARDFSALLNGAHPFRRGAEAYGFAGLRLRDATSPFAFFRRALDDRTVRAIYPDGYLAAIESNTADYSAALGVRGNLLGWEWDMSSVYGTNTVDLYVHNTNNVTLGAASPTDFYSGALKARQWTSNLDFRRALRPVHGMRMNIAAGAEFRIDGYRIEQGEPDAYRDGGVRILDGPSRGRLGAVGAQGGPGFQPADEVDADRQNTGVYLDLETGFERFLVNVAGRVEKYEGDEAVPHGKAAVRIEPFRGLAIRAAAATGFRAPSPMQSYYTATRGILRLVNGVSTALVVRTLAPESEAAQLLGAKPLVPETSVNLSGGLVLDIGRLLVVTADYYRIDIDDRIVLTDEFTGPVVEKLFEDRGMRGIIGGRYFGNLIDTRTRGLDVVANHVSDFGRTGMWRLTAGLNETRTRVTRISSPPPVLSGLDSVVFSRVQEGTIERGQPTRTITITNNYSVGRIAVNLHNQRFGEAALLDSSDPASDQVVSPKWITDLSVSYRHGRRWSITASAANLFDVYPAEWNDFKLGVAARGMSNFGIFRYPGGISPFGMNGRTVYLHLTWRRIPVRA